MTTTQNDRPLLTESQLDSLSGGPHYTTWNGVRHDFQARREDRLLANAANSARSHRSATSLMDPPDRLRW